MSLGIYSIFFGLSSTLKPADRWKAAGRPFGGSFVNEPWFIPSVIALLVVLVVLLLVVSLTRKTQTSKSEHKPFIKFAKKRGLSAHECRTLLNVAYAAGIEQVNTIFSMESAFDQGAAKLIKQSLAHQQDVEQSKQLKNELLFLREKLGFQKHNSGVIGSAVKHTKLSSRYIPIDRKLRMTRRKTRDEGDIEFTVVENNDLELKVRSEMPVTAVPGELWRVRYYFGASVWEFDTTVAASDGDILALNHSDNVRFINRRRFLRVAVNKPAFIAVFPFTESISTNDAAMQQHDRPDVPEDTWASPEFVAATVTELAGPGLRVEAPLSLNVGDRVLLRFRLDEEKQQDSQEKGHNDKDKTRRIIQDIGFVRHIKPTEDAFSFAVELTGLADSDVNELIRITNNASFEAKSRAQADDEMVNTENQTREPVTVEGT